VDLVGATPVRRYELMSTGVLKYQWMMTLNKEQCQQEGFMNPPRHGKFTLSYLTPFINEATLANTIGDAQTSDAGKLYLPTMDQHWQY
jgi:hypothetical protein